MARPPLTLPRTLFPLSKYAEMMGYGPNHFWQIKNPKVPHRCTCDIIWRHDKRLRLARTLLNVERDMKNSLGFAVAPEWEADERHQWNGGYNFTSRYGRVIAGGRMVEVALGGGDNVDIIYSDEDGDGVVDWATITITLTAAEAAALIACEVVVYPHGYTVNEIRYLDVSISGTTLTIQGYRSYFLDPVQWYTDDEIKLSDATGKFLAKVDVYRRYHDADQDAFEMRREPTQLYGAEGLVETEDAGKVRILNARVGILQPIANECPYWWEGWDQAALWYYAGWLVSEDYECDTFGDLMSVAVMRLTNARLPKQPCGCGATHHIYQDDREIDEGAVAEFGSWLTPFGSHVGEVFAWRVVDQLRIRKGRGI